VHRYTLEEFFALDPPPGGGHYELIAGVLYVVPPPDGSHNLTASRLVGVFSAYATTHPERCVLFVPRTAIWTSANTYVEPDLFLVRSDALARMGADRLTTADLVVEILSPSSAVYDRTAKADADPRVRVGRDLDIAGGRVPRERGEHRRAEALRVPEVGRRERLGQMNGRWRDVLLFERRSAAVA
jgi:hypothetical protein